MDLQESRRKEVESLRDPKWIEVSARNISIWPGAKRAGVRALLEEPKNRWESGSDDARVKKTVAHFDTLDEKGRRRLWRALFPRLASHLERAWSDAAQMTYLSPGGCYSFRAPRRAATIARVRAVFFNEVCDALRGLDRDAEWVAAWAPHIEAPWGRSRALGWLLGSILRSGGDDADRVRDVLVRSLNGDHEVGRFGRHVIVALLNSGVRDDWETVKGLLLAAQRQEGLRQAILEAIDEADPDAFRFMIGVILEHDLARFSSTVRAFDVWFGLKWAGGSVKVVHESLERLCRFMDDGEALQNALDDGTPDEAYVALWVMAHRDAETALHAVERMLARPEPERRCVAFITQSRICLFPEALVMTTTPLILDREHDERLLMLICAEIASYTFHGPVENLFEALARLHDRMGSKARKLPALVWPWVAPPFDRRTVAHAMLAVAKADPERLIPYADSLDASDCVSVIEAIAGLGHHWVDGQYRARKRRELTPQARSLCVRLCGDARSSVQAHAFEALSSSPVEKDEVDVLVSNLHRTAATFRQGALARLGTLADARALEVAEALLGDEHPKKRAAGLELASHLIAKDRSVRKSRDLIARHSESLADPTTAGLVQTALGTSAAAPTLADCLGLVPKDGRCPLLRPVARGVELDTSATKACLRELGELFVRHAQTEVKTPRPAEGEVVEGRGETATLGTIGFQFPRPPKDGSARTAAPTALPLAPIWLEWLERRGAATRDADGLELLRACVWSDFHESYANELPAPFRTEQSWSLRHGIARLLEWMALLSEPRGAGSFLVQFLEDRIANAPAPAWERRDAKKERPFWSRATQRRDVVAHFESRMPAFFTTSDRARLGALRMVELARHDDHRSCDAWLHDFCAAFDAGLVNEHDLTWALLTKEGIGDGIHYGWRPQGFGPIDRVTTLRPPPELVARPSLLAAAQRVRDRLLEVELARGERPSETSKAAVAIRHAGGAAVFFRLARALGGDSIVRQDQWGEPTRAYSLSRLIGVTTPEAGDSPERFKALFEESGIRRPRLLELTMLAPQWARLAESVLEQPGLEEAVWWIHAHTKRNDYWRAGEFRELWAAQIAERTELESQDLEEGAVDVAWFRRVLDAVGAEGWTKLLRPAKYASNSGGHKRAELFAQAMLGGVPVESLIARIDGTRHQDSVRALGLVPLPDGADERRAETLSRYERFQEFKRRSRAFGSMRQASEGRAVEIGLKNLARTAGFRDPQRLEWAMEREAVADLTNGPVSVTEGEVVVTLSIDADGDPEFGVTKKGAKLKSVPANVRKHEAIAELRSRVSDLRRQRSRMRRSLEESMCRGDRFTREEMGGFFAHPLLRPIVERLVFVGDGALVGYPAEGGAILRDRSGHVEPIGSNDELRVAHPLDLFERGEWHEWQQECFAQERMQPFKQVFRELYPKTASERGVELTRRYAGHQVNPRQAMALLRQRQWIHSPGEGVRRVHHDLGLIAELWFQESFYTPAEVDGLTLEGVGFRRRDRESKSLVLDEIPDRVFSEAMRDLDLVVSVAHAGGVDPEASASTVEMRAALLRETCRLLKLDNVRIEGQHAFITGTRAEYGVHLGSATTSITPGRALFIVAVHSQYRGRLFLPFADDDPRTAEVMAKVLLLSRDAEIKDPSILEQIGR